MPIRWDSLLVRATARELDRLLAGQRLRALRLDGPSGDVALLFEERSLLWRLHPLHGQPSLSGPLEPGVGDLRMRSDLRAVAAPTDERIIRFSFEPTRKAPEGLTLVVELLGNQWNALMLDAGSGIVRHLLRRREGKRPQRVGHPYRPPEARPRRGADGGVTLADWYGVLGSAPPEERERTLTDTFAWSSPVNAPALLGLDLAGSAAALETGHERWLSMARDDATEGAAVLRSDSDVQPYPFLLPGFDASPTASLMDAFIRSAGPDSGDASGAASRIGPELFSRLRARLRSAERRLAALEAQVATQPDPGSLRAIGDLILARYAEIPKGAPSTRLADFQGGLVDVALDPALPPHENASAYYERASKAERASERLPGMIEEAKRTRERWTRLSKRAEDGTLDPPELIGALGPDPTARVRDALGPALPYRTFRSSGGLEIRVGRGSGHNDDLTFRHSSPEDVWLHARHATGAHVILRWSRDGRPPARDLEEAAMLAALHSKARTSGSVPVDWTRRKYVRKPRKSPPGTVIPDRVETLFVEPDPETVGRLSER